VKPSYHHDWHASFVPVQHSVNSSSFKVSGLNHVGIAVFNLEEATMTFLSKFGLEVSEKIESKEQGLYFALVDTGNCILELMEPIDTESTVAKFLEKQKRNAIHHIAFSVDTDLESTASQLKALGVDMIYPSPRIGVMGHPINFCHPKFTSGILVELCDTTSTGNQGKDRLNE
jgi:methylmalonyl-CoA epimerase